MVAFNWDRHWKEEEEPEGARQFALRFAEMLAGFMEGNRIESVADYGCGPATTLFALARRFPEVSFHGFDAAASIISKNREKARLESAENISFDLDSLPHPQTGLRFDLITCLSTLHYVEEVEGALKALYGLLNPGGSMIFNYPSRYTRWAKIREITPDDEENRRRFATLLAGRNLTSQRRIGEILGVRPRRFYSSKRHNVYALVRKIK
jgi:trans-aconitate methyltransferase